MQIGASVATVVAPLPETDAKPAQARIEAIDRPPGSRPNHLWTQSYISAARLERKTSAPISR